MNIKNAILLLNENLSKVGNVRIGFYDEKSKELLNETSIGNIDIADINRLILPKESFFVNILTNRVYGLEIDQLAKHLQIINHKCRIVYLFESDDKNINQTDMYNYLLNNRQLQDDNLIVLPLDDNKIVLIKETEKDFDKIDNYASILMELVNERFQNNNIKLSYGTPSDDLRSLLKTYREASLSYEIGTTFHKNENIYSYRTLGLGRLIFEAPIELCESFINESFSNASKIKIDDEFENEIKSFFDHNLNISETARDLNVHRNTLVYRFDKIKQITGLDLRLFNDAITFYISMMIYKYIKKKGLSVND